MAEPTPRPWEVHKYNHYAGEMWLGIGHAGRGPIATMAGRVDVQKPSHWSPVAEMKFLITADEQQQANADLICAAVNAWDDPAALRARADEIEKGASQ